MKNLEVEAVMMRRRRENPPGIFEIHLMGEFSRLRLGKAAESPEGLAVAIQ
jgi:hypothetical protein